MVHADIITIDNDAQNTPVTLTQHLQVVEFETFGLQIVADELVQALRYVAQPISPHKESGHGRPLQSSVLICPDKYNPRRVDRADRLRPTTELLRVTAEYGRLDTEP